MNVNTENSLFLLGGYDLEMLTIRNILSEQGYSYADRKLDWNGARLSRYRKDISRFLQQKPSGTVYGIELTEDLSLPSSCYHSIDHHNERAGQPSALEQILTLLHLTATRYHQLVAANDRLYIPGMQALGATPDEIKHIRQADREAQGVTRQDEILAEKSIAEELETVGRLQIVRAYTPHFSPICDRLYPYHSLLVYTTREWMFYGEGSSEIYHRFRDTYPPDRLFCGGGPNGYIGCPHGVFTETEIYEIIRHIRQIYA